jgi:hypothetical protein
MNFFSSVNYVTHGEPQLEQFANARDRYARDRYTLSQHGRAYRAYPNLVGLICGRKADRD